MKQKDDKAIWYVILICCSVLAWPLYMMLLAQPEPQPARLTSIIELQEGLVEAGYDIGPHGIDGRLADCNTVQAWIKYEKDVIFNEYAAKFMTKTGGPE